MSKRASKRFRKDGKEDPQGSMHTNIAKMKERAQTQGLIVKTQSGKDEAYNDPSLAQEKATAAPSQSPSSSPVQQVEIVEARDRGQKRKGGRPRNAVPYLSTEEYREIEENKVRLVRGAVLRQNVEIYGDGAKVAIERPQFW
eukprot:CAMPEP_0117750476 /NCGR_PEP_ID=MMETSP0947-20121206/10398_1 /TAXON_ID=44440 /ORGANISM="Chattonella subsalsa, Strain CCMP2191" /LENGTH=141 /DNA_ID=CAMNT_0005568665 /DNA_START=129 /DNA_END=551 /DNA_ORIENTATION=+